MHGRKVPRLAIAAPAARLRMPRCPPVAQAICCLLIYARTTNPVPLRDLLRPRAVGCRHDVAVSRKHSTCRHLPNLNPRTREKACSTLRTSHRKCFGEIRRTSSSGGKRIIATARLKGVCSSNGGCAFPVSPDAGPSKCPALWRPDLLGSVVLASIREIHDILPRLPGRICVDQILHGGRYIILDDVGGRHRIWLQSDAGNPDLTFHLPMDRSFYLRSDATTRFTRRCR